MVNTKIILMKNLLNLVEKLLIYCKKYNNIAIIKSFLSNYVAKFLKFGIIMLYYKKIMVV